MSFTFLDPPEPAVRLVRALAAFTTSSNTTLYDDDKVGVTGMDGVSGNQLNNDMVQNGTNGENGDDDNIFGRDTYEFVSFLLWYLFLVICCILPTCCAYRRRRLVEARMAQQLSFERLHQQNVFILSHLRAEISSSSGGMDSEQIKAERTRRITEELQSTTFTVEAKDISENVDTNKKKSEKPSPTVSMDEELGGALELYDEEASMDDTILTLPSEAVGGSPENPRTVRGGCAICLCPFEEGDTVTWSRKESCRHCFHTNCVIPWLAKKNEPKCPICRQDFCTIEPIPDPETTNTQRLAIMTPFGLIPAAIGTRVHHPPFFMRSHHAIRIPTITPDLTVATLSSAGTQTLPQTIDLSQPYPLPQRPSTMVIANDDAVATTDETDVPLGTGEVGRDDHSADTSPNEVRDEETGVSTGDSSSGEGEEHCTQESSSSSSSSSSSLPSSTPASASAENDEESAASQQ